MFSSTKVTFVFIFKFCTFHENCFDVFFQFAFAFIMVHVFHLHGWFHADIWLENVVKPLGGAQFKPFNAASTAGEALQGIGYLVFYVIGVLSCVYHLANGIWTMGITWGIWTTPKSQHWANYPCAAFGIALATIGLGALIAMWTCTAAPETNQAAVGQVVGQSTEIATGRSFRTVALDKDLK